MRFIISNVKHRSVFCTDGEFHHHRVVGPAGWNAKTWKTKKGAKQFADKRFTGQPHIEVLSID